MGNISICVCVWYTFWFFFLLLLFVLEGGRGILIWALSTLETDLCWSVMYFKVASGWTSCYMCPLVQSCVYLALLSPVWTWPWMTSVPTVHWNLLIEIQFGDSETGEVGWKFRVVQGANWNSNCRATFQRLTTRIWGMHKCGYFSGDDKSLKILKNTF